MNHFSFAHFRRYLAGLLSLFLLTGCAVSDFVPSFHNFKWELEVTKIVKSSEAEGRHSALRNIGRTQFEDDVLRIDAQTKDPMEVVFVLINKTPYDLRIDWRRAKFVDIYRKTHPVTVTQFRPSRVDNLAEGHTEDDGTFTEIKRAQFVRIRLTPTDRPYITKLWSWELQGIRGRTVEVSFPLLVEGKNYEYVSAFQITKFDFESARKPADPL